MLLHRCDQSTTASKRDQRRATAWRRTGITVLFASFFVSATVQAQSLSSTDSLTSPQVALYNALGQKEGIGLLVNDLVDRLRADKTLGPPFRKIKAAYLKEQLTDQLCRVTGGPCVYEGEEMKKSHAELKIGTGEFNQLVEILQDCMDARDIPFAIQNRLLARLAPMHREIITASPAANRQGKLLLTGGVSSVDGAAGGGLTPWATIGTYASDQATGFSAHATRVSTKDYGLNTYGLTLGIHNRWEVSLSRQSFDTGVTGPGLGIPGLQLNQDILGGKWRVAGDAILDSDNWQPQVAVGVEFKSLQSSGLDGTLSALGAKKNGTDLYVSATKLFLAQGILVNGTLRATNANQNGLLGFGGTLGGSHDQYQLMPELSVAWLANRHLAVGMEYRRMPNNLQDPGAAAGLGDGLRAQDWKDVFVAWAPNKTISLTLAYVDLGVIVPATTGNRTQTGAYLSAQVGF
jgi:truncated hemoglobin YjbI